MDNPYPHNKLEQPFICYVYVINSSNFKRTNTTQGLRQNKVRSYTLIEKEPYRIVVESPERETPPISCVIPIKRDRPTHIEMRHIDRATLHSATP